MLLFFFLLWMVLNGKFTLELLLLGIVFAGLVYYFAHTFFGYSFHREAVMIRNAPLLILYFLDLVWEIIKAALLVMGTALGSMDKLSPVIVEFHSGLKDSFQNILLANSITLTPGTITLVRDGDHIVVLCLKREYSEGLDESSFVHILRKMHTE